nr:9006_t:CDS:2 [Entrophospora candida]
MLIEIFLTLLVSYLTYLWVIYPFYLSPLRKIPGPPPDHFLLGSFVKNIKSSQAIIIDQTDLVDKYGGIFKTYELFNKQILTVTDEKALQKILVNEATDFIKPKGFAGLLKGILGNGILFAEGEAHKRQRKIMNPTFSHGNIKDMVPTFTKIGNTVKEMWKNEINNSNDDDVGKKRAKINVMSYTSKATLDVIGIVGFDYEFNSLTTSSKLSQAYEGLFDSKNRFALAYRLLANTFPILKSLPVKQIRDIKEATSVVDEITTKLVNDKLDKFAKGELNNKNDLLSGLIKANNEGHETTSVAVTWALYYLSRDLEIQDKLRKEIIKEFPDKDIVPTLEQINSLEYLNAVCKETLRLAPPAPITVRESAKDTIINGYLVPKGTIIFVPIFTVHNMASTWGPDVREFKPSRWFDEHTKKVITNSNYMPFMIGPRSCIGNKVAFNEMKVFLAVFLRNFEFHEVEGLEIKRQLNMTFRPSPSLQLWVNEVDN